MSMAFSPEAGQYFDAGKLPTTDVLIRHLGPSTFSQRQVENGILIESAGTLTVDQAVLGTAAGIGAAALPRCPPIAPMAVCAHTPLERFLDHFLSLMFR